MTKLNYLLIIAFTLAIFPCYSAMTIPQPDEVNLIDPPIDSVQKTVWNGFPVLIHRRTPEQLKSIEESFKHTPTEQKRFLAYQSIARAHGNHFASAIRGFTEKYIAERNVYMSEIPEFGIYSMVSPILGCAVSKRDEGFIDPCNNVSFDFAGKVVNSIGYNHLRLTVPPHKITDNRLVFLEGYERVEIIDFTPDILAMNISRVEKAIYAVDWENLNILKSIVEQYPEVINQTNTNGSNVLHVSAYHKETLEYLLGFKDIKINQINNSGFSPLLFAVIMENFTNAETLIRHGAKLEGYSMNGKTVPSVFEYLITRGNKSKTFAKEVVSRLKKVQINSVEVD